MTWTIEQREEFDKFREAVKNTTELCKEIVENPSILDGFDHTEIAWLSEQLGLLKEIGSRHLARIEEVMGAEWMEEHGKKRNTG